MTAFFSHHYLPEIIGFTFSVIGGHLLIKPTMASAWKAIPLDQKTRPSVWQPEAVGLIERALFTAAILTGNPGFVAVWLALKTAGQWTLPWGGTRRHEVYRNFLIGTGLSIAAAAAGAYCTLELRDKRLVPAVFILTATAAATLALRFWFNGLGQESATAAEAE
jgi:hypothetical protein